MKTYLYKIFSGILIAIYLSSVVLSGVVSATPNKIHDQQVPAAKHEPKHGINPETGKLSFIGNGDPISVLGVSDVKGMSAQERARGMANAYGKDFGLKNPSQELRLLKSEKDSNGKDVTRFQQIYKGIPAIAGELIVNTNADGDLLSISGEVSSDLTIDTKPAVKSQQASKAALDEIAKLYKLNERELTVSNPELWIFDESLLTASTRPVELVWRMEVSAQDAMQPIREMVLVNAQAGTVSWHINQVDAQTLTLPVYFDLELDEARGWIYGSDSTGNKIDVISMSTLALVKSFTLVNGANPKGIALSSDGSELAIAQYGASSILFLNPDTGATIATVIPNTTYTKSPWDVIYGRTGRLYTSGASDYYVHVIDTTTHLEVSRSTLNYSLTATRLAISADKNWLYASRSSGSPMKLYRYDVSTDTFPEPTSTAHTSNFSASTFILDTVDNLIFTDTGQVWTPDLKGNIGSTGSSGQVAYLPSHNGIAIASSTTNTVVFASAQNFYTISTYSLQGPMGPIVSQADGNKIFVSTNNGIVSIDLSNFPPGIPAVLPAGSLPYADVIVDEPHGVLYGSNMTGHKIDIISMTTLQVVDQIRFNNGARPQGMNLSPDGNELAVALNGASSIAFINTNTRTISATVIPNLDGAILPFDVLYGRTGRLYSSGSNGYVDYLHVFDTTTHMEVGISPYPNTISDLPYLAVSADKNFVYANQSQVSPNKLYKFDVTTDNPVIQTSTPHTSGYSADTYLLLTDNTKVFTNRGQVWPSDLTAQIGSFNASGNLVEIPGQNLVAVISSASPGLITFVRTSDFYTASTTSISSVSAVGASAASLAGDKLYVNTNTGIKVLDIASTSPSSISIVSGSPQSIQVSAQFQQPLKVKVRNVAGNPMPGVVVTFTAPSTGVSGIFSDTNTNVTTTVTDANGVATSSLFAANNTAGTFAVKATVSNLASSADFQLTNLASVNCTVVNGSGSATLFQPYIQYRCGKVAEGVASGDFNSDGKMDVALVTNDGLLLIYLQDSNGNLSTQPRVYAGSASPVLAAGDLNHDGRDDIVIPSGNAIRVFLQKSDGLFAFPIDYPTGYSAGALAVGDVNDDGLADVVVSGGSNLMGVFTQKQDGTLNPIVTYPALASAEIAIGDVNADGLNDVVSMNNNQTSNQLQIFIQNNNVLNAYISKGLIGCSSFCTGRGIGIGDVNADGWSDIVMSYGGNRPTSYIAVFVQDGNGNLLAPTSYSSYDIPEPVEIADINSDNLSDIITLHSGWQNVGVYLQQSNGIPGTESLYSIPYKTWYNPLGLNISDVNTDGLPDVLIADGQGLVVLYRNSTIPPTPTITPTSTLTFTPGPTLTPSPTFTPGPGPSRTPGPSSTPGPSPTPVPSSYTGNRRTYTASGGSALPGTFLCDQAQISCTNGLDLDADSAHQYAADTFVFYNTHHMRNSIDNQGSTILSTVHYGVRYQNAFWNGSQMVYGDGMAADDVVGHELTHGVTQYTSGLIYYGQSGAINESFSDVWGEFIDQTNNSGNDSPSVKWLIGEDTPLGVIRSMINPPAYGDPDKMSSPYYYTGSYDNGGVHINSGVNNKAAYLMVDGDAFNGRNILGIGLNKTVAIYYEAQVHLLTAGANYNDLYYALNQACQNLIGGADGITPNDCIQVQLSTEAVEMIPAPLPTPTPTFTSTFTPTNTATFTPTYTPTPVIITLVLQPDAAAGLDTYIYNGPKNSTYGSNPVMGIGEDNNANNRFARSLLKFDLSSIPANATINSATLSLWTNADLSSNDRTIRVYRLKTAFNETQATWTIAATGTSWQTAGASGANDRETSAIGSVTILNNEALNLEKQIVLAPDKIRELVNGTIVNKGFILVADTESNDRFDYKSSDSTSSTQRPKLVIQYIVPSVTPSSTPTLTNTPLPTNTFTQTPSATSTSTATSTPLPTTTSTGTPTATFTASVTPTNTPTSTSTWTPLTATPTSTFTRTPTATFTASATATPTASPTSTATTSSGFPITVVRDNFNRANGAIGTSWSGYSTAFAISSNQLDVVSSGLNTYILWNSSSFGADQEAYVTFTQIDTTSNEQRLILKSQSSKSSSSGLISILYDGAGHNVQVWTYHPTQGWVQYGTNLPVTFANGDQFGARARPDGTVEIYQNGTLLATRNITAWPYYANGGYIGLWFVNAPAALLDNFGGGTR